MTHKKIFVGVCLAAAILFAVLPGSTAHAQEFPFIEILYPQQGSPGEVVDLLLRGGGFDSVKALNAVAISGFEVPVLDYAILSDEAVEVRILIPEDMPVGVTEITFVFDDFGADALFVVSEDTAAPLEYRLFPQEGRQGTEITLQLETFNEALGPFGGVTLWGVDLPVLAFEVSEAGDSWAFRVFLPPEVPAEEGEIRLYFENSSLRESFFVFGPEFDQPPGPAVGGYDPIEGQRDTEIEFILQGNLLSELGDLVGLTVAGVDLPILDYFVEAEEYAVVRTFLPPELPLGETRIAFYYESYGPFTDIFQVNPREPEPDEIRQPVIYSVSPLEGDHDSDLLLRLGGVNLDLLGALVEVRIGDFALTDTDYEILTTETSVVYAYLPEDAPSGEQSLTIAFENAEISTDFLVRRLSPVIPLWLLAIVGIVVIAGAVLVGGGILVVRAFRGSRAPQEKPDERGQERQPRFDFKVVPDLGTQTIEPAEDNLTLDLNLRFEIYKDPGEQEINTGGGRLTDEV